MKGIKRGPYKKRNKPNMPRKTNTKNPGMDAVTEVYDMQVPHPGKSSFDAIRLTPIRSPASSNLGYSDTESNNNNNNNNNVQLPPIDSFDRFTPPPLPMQPLPPPPQQQQQQQQQRFSLESSIPTPQSTSPLSLLSDVALSKPLSVLRPPPPFQTFIPPMSSSRFDQTPRLGPHYPQSPRTSSPPLPLSRMLADHPGPLSATNQEEYMEMDSSAESTLEGSDIGVRRLSHLFNRARIEQPLDGLHSPLHSNSSKHAKQSYAFDVDQTNERVDVIGTSSTDTPPPLPLKSGFAIPLQKQQQQQSGYVSSPTIKTETQGDMHSLLKYSLR
ncbi:hypothetical protein BX661DRAFT_207412 [Kickxella alabastrina]|uniref:uncharacterized protein n=1 Tax=Kickxella alabastrina TaxID=61397 RepID=UPI00221EB242|nr:uncharacterized protein BX661DRAFT_207412 [Kickxella alabastrina]KAI7822120.1 hypothetical protein BX661DRAFT_207412 [Kickxella alabastrina]